MAAIRQGGYKLIEHFGDRFDRDGRYVIGHHLEPFDLENDISERINLAAQMPEKARRMPARRRAWLASTPAEIPGLNPNYDPKRAFRETRVKPPAWP